MKNSSTFQLSLNESLNVFQSLIHHEDTFDHITKMVINCLKNNNKLLFCGNGGSAADSMHIATEFTCRFNKNRRAYPAIALTTDGGLITAISNDYCFNNIFARQVEALGQKGDVLFLLSTSGNSTNLYHAIKHAEKKEMKSIALLGKGGGQIMFMPDISLVINSNNTARIQEAHKFLLHVLCERIDEMEIK